jgi:hypothetical protein
MEWSEFVDFLAAQVQELLETEYGQVRYGDVDIAYWLTGLLVGVVLLTIGRVLFRPTRHTRLHSGHAVDRRFQRGPLAMALYNAPKVLLALAMVGLSIALADPFLTATEEVTGDVESRVRIDLVDTSLSMAWEFLDTGRSRSEVAREAHLGFLEMRREKNDRVSLWLFSSYPYMVDDFVLDDELYYFQVMEAPFVTVKILAPQSGTTLDSVFVPEDKVRIIPTEGSTNITLALRSVIRHFDQDDASGASEADQHRAVLIITDAGVDEMPDDEFEALSARDIVPYVIYINSDEMDQSLQQPKTPPLLERIRTFGGEYFDVTDEDSLQRAYEAIDRRETVRVELSHRAQRVPIFSRVLLMSMALLVVGIPAGFVAELVWGTHP